MPIARTTRPSSPVRLTLLILLVITSIGVVASTAAHIDLDAAIGAPGLTAEESAYYEYVAPRLDRLVSEVDDVVIMVDGKSRDVVALATSGARIEKLTDEITRYGETHDVPARFAGIHAEILDATGTATYTFEQARQALRSFDFSGMTALVADFQAAADGLHRAQDALRIYGGGTAGAWQHAETDRRWAACPPWPRQHRTG